MNADSSLKVGIFFDLLPQVIMISSHFQSIENFFTAKSRKNLWFFVLIWYGVIFTLSQIPGTDSESTREYMGDYNSIFRMMAHACFFAVLAVLIYVSLQGNFTKNRKYILFSVVFNSLCGITDEIHQYYVPFRHCRLIDVEVDTIGGIVGIAIVLVVYSKIHRKIR